MPFAGNPLSLDAVLRQPGQYREEIEALYELDEDLGIGGGCYLLTARSRADLDYGVGLAVDAMVAQELLARLSSLLAGAQRRRLVVVVEAQAPTTSRQRSTSWPWPKPKPLSLWVSSEPAFSAERPRRRGCRPCSRHKRREG